jgi:hypothetical protein
MGQSPTKKRRLVYVPEKESKRGRLWSYGVHTLAALSGKSVHWVRDLIARGALDPTDLRSVATWLASLQRQETPGKGWQPCPPNLSDETIAGLIAASPRLVRTARRRGHFDPADGLSLAAWIYERRRWAKPVPPRQFENYLLVALPARSSDSKRTGPGVSSTHTNSRRLKQLKAAVRDLQDLGFAEAQARGTAHVYLKPDYLPLVAVQRLVSAMRAEHLRAGDVPLRRRRQLALGPSPQRGGSRVSRRS